MKNLQKEILNQKESLEEGLEKTVVVSDEDLEKITGGKQHQHQPRLRNEDSELLNIWKP